MPSLLVNENFPAPSTHLLRQSGIDVLAIGETHQGMPDADVLALARRTKRWLVTFDTDYADLLFRRRLPPPPAVLLLREPHYRAAEPASWILPLMQNPTDTDGLFCVVSRDRVRKRPFLRVASDDAGG
jgi:predicted nuclease of predicted toxin-antitoxin system